MIFIGDWCNGSTTLSERAGEGSNPSSPTNLMNDIHELLIKEFGPLKGFQPHAVANTHGNCLQIFLEDCSYYAEWIKGEGGDIALYRAMDNNRVVGANLPLTKWNGKFPIDIV